jgi:hypothetical protein
MDHHSDSQQPSAPAPNAGPVVSSRRRRFLQAGVPVGLTLASRPVMAWHCNTTSAWGSAVLRNGGASVQARAAAAVLTNTECWTISNWVNNTARSAVSTSPPWSFVAAYWYSGRSVSYCKSNLTVAKVYPGGLKNVSPSAKVSDLFAANAGSYATMMLVARLNTLFAGHNVAQCVVSSTGEDMLVKMASVGPNSFKPNNAGSTAAWTESDFRSYLYSNYLVS